ncbi:unnamed protein product, partial [Ectocarpus fasciculatus]
LLPDHDVLSLFFHDETTTKENDDGDHQWMSVKKGAAMKVKGEGRAAHISDEVLEAVEVLKKAAADCAVLKTANDPWTTAVIMTVGKQHDGYWTSDRMCAQLPAAIAMFELTNGPHRKGVFIFDNSTGHNAYDKDALLAHKINSAPGGEK